MRYFLHYNRHQYDSANIHDMISLKKAMKTPNKITSCCTWSFQWNENNKTYKRHFNNKEEAFALKKSTDERIQNFNGSF